MPRRINDFMSRFNELRRGKKWVILYHEFMERQKEAKLLKQNKSNVIIDVKAD